MRDVASTFRLTGTSDRHAFWEDALGVVTGITLLALAVSIYAHLGMVTGGVAGMALLAHYALGADVGAAFFLINLPFYALALWRVGLSFTLRTFLAVAGFSALVTIQPHVLSFATLHPVAGAVVAGLLLGFGMLALFRHRTSVGGVSVLGFWLQERFGIRAGWVQLAIDLAILAASALFIEPWLLALSVASAVIMNVLIAVNHRQDRYIAK